MITRVLETFTYNTEFFCRPCKRFDLPNTITEIEYNWEDVKYVKDKLHVGCSQCQEEVVLDLNLCPGQFGFPYSTIGDDNGCQFVHMEMS